MKLWILICYSRVRVFSKVIVTLQAFRGEISQYSDKNHTNWKRKVFMMFDELKNQVGQLDLSISLIRIRKETFNPSANANSNTQSPLYYQQPKTLNASSFPVYPNTNTINKTKDQSQSQAFQERPKTSGMRPNETIDVRASTTEYENKATLKNAYVKDEPGVIGNISSLKTITEGFYCPPMMLFQKVANFVV